MTSIRDTPTGRTVVSEEDLSIGRSAANGLCLAEPVGARKRERVFVGEGRAGCVAEPLDGGDPVRMEHGLLALPSEDDPRITVYEHRWGGWVVERSGEADRDVKTGDVVRAGDRAWRLHCRPLMAGKRFAHPVQTPPVSLLVSSDGECLEVRFGTKERQLAVRARDEDYLLLTLVRSCLASRRDDAKDWERGWIYEDRAPGRPDGTPRRVDLDVFRIRRRAGALGMRYPVDLILRHAETRQLRIGARQVSLWVRGRGGVEQRALSSTFSG
ncbi:MAG TPA: hypothetical protein VGM06_13070 [Polyangiaceae bacterium]|jgi:hypothetical protein